MTKWIEFQDFIEADVVRWTEGVFDRKGRSKKSVRIGERRVTAEILKIDDQWAHLLVRHCEITRDEQFRRVVLPFKPETTIKRARKTLLRGKPQRLLWDDETARAAVIAPSKETASRFISLPDYNQE